MAAAVVVRRAVGDRSRGISGGGGVERTLVYGQAGAASAPDAGCLLSPGERVVFRECWAGLSVLLGKLQGDDAMEQRAVERRWWWRNNYSKGRRRWWWEQW